MSLYVVMNATFKIYAKHSKSKGMQEKNQTWVFGADRKLHSSGSLPNNDPRDGIFYPVHSQFKILCPKSHKTVYLFIKKIDISPKNRHRETESV